MTKRDPKTGRFISVKRVANKKTTKTNTTKIAPKAKKVVVAKTAKAKATPAKRATKKTTK